MFDLYRIVWRINEIWNFYGFFLNAALEDTLFASMHIAVAIVALVMQGKEFK